MRAVLLLPLFWMLTASGCAVWQQTPRNYQTVQANPHRDEELAKKKTKQAGKAWRKGKFDKAELLLQEALIADVQYGPAHNNLGLIYYEQGRYYLAAWEFEYAMQTLTSRAEPANNLAMVLEAANRFEQAIEYYTLARELDPNNPEYTGNLVRVLLKKNPHDTAAQELLSELLLIEDRPQWRSWAREQLATGKFKTQDSPAELADPFPPPQVEIQEPSRTELIPPGQLDLPLP